MPSKHFKEEIGKFKQYYFELLQYWVMEYSGGIGLSKSPEETLNSFDDDERYLLIKFLKDELTNFLKNYRIIAKEYTDSNTKFIIEKSKFIVVKSFVYYDDDTKEESRVEQKIHIYFIKVKKRLKYLNDEISFYEKYESFEKSYDIKKALQSKFVWLKTKQDLFFLFDTLEKFGFIFPDNVNDILRKYFIIYDSKTKKFESLEGNTIRDFKSKVKNEFSLLKSSLPMKELRKQLEDISNKP